MNVVTRIKSIRDNGKGEALEKLVGGDLKFLKETTKVTNYYRKIMLQEINKSDLRKHTVIRDLGN